MGGGWSVWGCAGLLPATRHVGRGVCPCPILLCLGDVRAGAGCQGPSSPKHDHRAPGSAPHGDEGWEFRAELESCPKP